MDYNWLYERLSPYYCHDNGRNGTDPVVLVKMVLIQHLYGIPSLRQTYKKKIQKEHVAKTAKIYEEQLRSEVNAERERLGKAPIEDDTGGDDDDSPPPIETKTVSTTDPDCGMYVKGQHERQMAYEAHIACDRHGMILDVVVTAGNVHDSVAWDRLYDSVTSKFDSIEFVTMDTQRTRLRG